MSQDSSPSSSGRSLKGIFWPLWILASAIWLWFLDSRQGAEFDISKFAVTAAVGVMVLLFVALFLTFAVEMAFAGGRRPSQAEPAPRVRGGVGALSEEGEDQVEVPPIIRPSPFRPTAETVWRAWVFLKWLLLGWLALAVIGAALYGLYLLHVIAGTGFVRPLGGAALLWIIVPLIVAGSAYVIPEYERVIVFRMGRVIGEKGPGRIRITPFIDEIRNRADVRITTPDIRFNNVPVKSSSGEGFIQIDVWLRLFLEVIDASKAVKMLQNVAAAVQAEAQVALGEASKEFTVDQVVGRVPEYLKQLADIVDPILEGWGVKARVGVSDTLLPSDLKLAYQKAEAAEVEAKALKILSAAQEEVMQGWDKAVKSVLSPEATDDQKIRLFLGMLGERIARALRGEGGAGPATFVGVSDLMSGMGVGGPGEGRRGA